MFNSTLNLLCYCMLLPLDIKSIYMMYMSAGQWRTGVPLLGLVRWPRRLRCSSCRLPPTAAPHRLPAPGRHRDPTQRCFFATDRPGWGARQQPLPPGKHPRPSPSPDPGRFFARCLRCTRFPEQHPASATLLYWEEDPTWEPGDRSHRERLQRDGKRPVQQGHDELKPTHPDRPWKLSHSPEATLSMHHYITFYDLGWEFYVKKLTTRLQKIFHYFLAGISCLTSQLQTCLVIIPLSASLEPALVPLSPLFGVPHFENIISM